MARLLLMTTCKRMRFLQAFACVAVCLRQLLGTPVALALPAEKYIIFLHFLLGFPCRRRLFHNPLSARCAMLSRCVVLSRCRAHCPGCLGL